MNKIYRVSVDEWLFFRQSTYGNVTPILQKLLLDGTQYSMYSDDNIPARLLGINYQYELANSRDYRICNQLLKEYYDFI